MCTTSSALIQEVTAAGREGFTGHNGASREKDRMQVTTGRRARTGHESAEVDEIHIHAKITRHQTGTVAAETTGAF